MSIEYLSNYQLFHEGDVNWDPAFEYLDDSSAADNGCGATFMGQFWYFGDNRKVSSILINAKSHLWNSRRVPTLQTIIDCTLYDH